MTVKERILENLKKCIAGIISRDDVFHENKRYFTLLPHICKQHDVRQPLPDLKLFDVVNDRWETVTWNQIKEVKWESTKLYPDEITDINLTEEYCEEQDKFRLLIKHMIQSEISEELSKYDNYTEHDLRMELYTNSGKRPSEFLSREELIGHIKQLLAIQSTHIINYDEIAACVGGVPLDFGPNSVCGDRYSSLQDMKNQNALGNAWAIWKEIIEWHISLNVRELEEELADTEDEEEREEIETAIELVKGALDGVSEDDFKSVYDIASYWPTLLYPPPSIALAV